MADTETLLGGVINELQKTNKLIELGNRDPNLASSIRQNLGEIINASRLQKDDQNYTEKKGIDQTDDEVINLGEKTETNTTLLKEILNSVISISEGQPSQSQQQSITKKEEAKEKGFLKALGGFEKRMDGYFKSFTGFLKDNKGIASILGLGALIFFLNSPTFLKFLGYLDKTLMPSIVKFFESIDRLGEKVDDFLGIEGGTTSYLTKLGLAGAAIIALTRPLKTLKFLLLDLPFATLSKGFKILRFSMGKSPGQLAKKAFVGPQKASRAFRLGQGLGKTGEVLGKAGKSISNVASKLTSSVANIGSKLSSFGGAKVAGRAALAGAKFIPFAGLIVSAAQGVYDGVKAGLDKAKDETATKADIAKAVLVGGAVSILTLGMGSPEGVKKFFGGIGDKIGEKFDAFKEMLPTKDELKEKMAGFAEGLKGKLGELGDKFTSLKDDMIGKFEDITGIELPTFEEVSEKIKNFGADLKKRVIDAIPTKEKIKEFGGKLLQFGKDLIKKDATQEQIDTAVAAALQKHFEQFHAMGENALNKMEGGQTTVVNQTTVDASNNSKMESVQHNMKQISHTDPTQLAVANAQ